MNNMMNVINVSGLIEKNKKWKELAYRLVFRLHKTHAVVGTPDKCDYHSCQDALKWLAQMDTNEQ